MTEAQIEREKLESQKLASVLIYEEARAEGAVLELAKIRDLEADRLAKPGSRTYRQLSISAPIYGSNVDIWIENLEHWERRDPGGDITIRINSPGGSVFDGLALFDTIMRLRRKGHHVTTHGLGMIASMATILMQAGDTRILDANSWFMIHELSSGGMGKTSDMEDDLKLMKRLQDRALDIYAERASLTKTQIARRWKRKDDWMSAQEAVKFGFADRVE